jgi:hypothetical protein
MLMTEYKFIITFGFPRSGTTFLTDVFGRGEGYINKWLTNGNPLHPMFSDTGLVSLKHLLGDVLFLRIIRNPIDILESWEAVRKYNEEVPKMYTNEIFFRMIFDHDSFKKQRDKINCIELKYEDLGDALKSTMLINKINDFVGVDNTDVLEKLYSEYKVKPVDKNHGKLSMGKENEILIPLDKRYYYYKMLERIFVENGYAYELG